MLNEKVTVTICGKAYNLRTDNASSLIRQGEEADRRITEYCREMSLSKDDACVFTVLDLLGDIDSANAPAGFLREEERRAGQHRGEGREGSRGKQAARLRKRAARKGQRPPSRSSAGSTPCLKAKTAPLTRKRSRSQQERAARTPAQRRSLKSPSRP